MGAIVRWLGRAMYLAGLALLVACLPGFDVLAHHNTGAPMATRLLKHWGYTQNVSMDGYSASPFSLVLAASLALLLFGNILAAMVRTPLSPTDLRRPLSAAALGRMAARIPHRRPGGSSAGGGGT